MAAPHARFTSNTPGGTNRSFIAFGDRRAVQRPAPERSAPHQRRTHHGGRGNVRYKPKFKADYKPNTGIGYRATLAGRRWNFRLNVNNLLNEQRKVATSESTLFVDPVTGALVASTTPGVRKVSVPERAVRYYDPISFRLTASVGF